MPNDEKLIVSVRVAKADQDAKFAFDYWTDAPESNIQEQLYAWYNKQGDLKWLFLGLAGALALLILCCFGVCIHNCCRKKSEDETHKKRDASLIYNEARADEECNDTYPEMLSNQSNRLVS